MNSTSRLRAVCGALAVLLMVTILSVAPSASAEQPPAPTCPDGLTLINDTTCGADPTVTTVPADVECPAGYTYSAAIARCEGPGVYTAAVPASSRCSDEINEAAAAAMVSYGGSVIATINPANGYCRLDLAKVEPGLINCPKAAPLLAGSIANGIGYCEYAPLVTAAVPAMCSGAPTTGTAADCMDTDPVISISCADAAAMLDGTNCVTTTCPVGTHAAGACVAPAMMGTKPVNPPVVPPVVHVPAPVAGKGQGTGHIVDAGSNATWQPVNVAAPMELAHTGPSAAQQTAVNGAVVLVGFGLIAMLWSTYFRKNEASA